MISFFRRIRFQLTQDNQPASPAGRPGSPAGRPAYRTGRLLKYSRYAIGEIALVVIGILIALQINTWKQEADNRKEERFYLIKLRDNLQQDTANLNLRISMLDSSRANLIRAIDDLKDKKENGFSDRTDITELMATYGFSPEKSTFDNLTTTGKLGLISNSTLIDSIHGYYNFIDNRAQGWNEAIETYTRNIIAPYILRKVPVYQTYHSEDLEGLQIKGASPEELSEDLLLRNLLGFKLNAIEEIRQVYSRLNRQASNLIEMIDEETRNSE